MITGERVATLALHTVAGIIAARGVLARPTVRAAIESAPLVADVAGEIAQAAGYTVRVRAHWRRPPTR